MHSYTAQFSHNCLFPYSIYFMLWYFYVTALRLNVNSIQENKNEQKTHYETVNCFDVELVV